MKSRASCWAAALATGVVVLGSATAARAQGCAMCYNAASAASSAAIQALRSGILVLTLPPVVIFVGIFVLVLRRRNRFDEEETCEACRLDEALVTTEYPGSAEFRFSETLRLLEGGEERPQTSEGARCEQPDQAAAEVAELGTLELPEPAAEAELAASAEHRWK